ncbi:MAG: hypothetical protein ACP5NX_03565 [Candidatus Bilamarchaeaceae archaeon]
MCAKNVHKNQVSTWKKVVVTAAGIAAFTFAPVLLGDLAQSIKSRHPELKPDRHGKVVVNMSASELAELTEGKSGFGVLKAEESKIDRVPYADVLRWDIESDKYRGTNPESGVFDESEVLGRVDKGYPFKCNGKTTCMYSQRVVVTTAENEKIVAILAIGDILTGGQIVHGTFLTFKITNANGEEIDVKALDLRDFANRFKEANGIDMFFGNIIVEKGFDKRVGEYYTFYIVGEEKPAERIKPKSFMIGFSYSTMKNKITGGELSVCMRD